MPELRIYRRALPHWRLEGSTYFITWRLQKGQQPLNHAERTLVKETILHFEHDRFDLYAFVIMDDHVHVLVTPLGKYTPEQIVHSWKSFSAHQMQRQDSGHRTREREIWEPEYFDRIVRNDRELLSMAEYIVNNPFTRWPDLTEYEWVGWRFD
ncbi:MAG: transposase [Pseudomonadota bacterium]